MIGDRQKQDVGDDATAIQSGRDTIINEGISTDEMRAIVETMADQLPKFAAVASSIVEARLKTFEDRVIGKFEEELVEHRKAFEDPDFQVLLRSAQVSYGRSGDEQACENLINLIAERAKLSTHTRLALSVNAAIDKAGVLTANEFAELSYSFFFKRVRATQAASLAVLAAFLRQFADPLMPELSRSETSYSYLEAMGCAKISIGTIGIEQILTRTYPHLLCRPISASEIESSTGDANFYAALLSIGAIRPAPSADFVTSGLSADDFTNAIKSAGLDGTKGAQVWSVIEGKALDKTELVAAFSQVGFQIQPHFEIWDETVLKNLDLTLIGMAIGYSNLKRISHFPADLAIWVH